VYRAVQLAAGVVLVLSVLLFTREALVAIIFTVRNIDHLHSVYRRIFMNLGTPWKGEGWGEGGDGVGRNESTNGLKFQLSTAD
jgi:hypothetical protein